MLKRRRNEDPPPFGKELHKLLALIGVKRSAFGDRGYTYSLHKQICRGERPPQCPGSGFVGRTAESAPDHGAGRRPL